MRLLSIIIPVYNVSKYLRECIDSILVQSFTKYEIILVDDGSTDGSSQICDEYARNSSKIKVLHQINAGVCAARNAGLNIVSGDYITFCDADDQYSPGWLSELVSKAEETDADIVLGGYTQCDEGNHIKRVFKPHDSIVVLSNSQDRMNYIINSLLLEGDGWEVWCGLFRSEIVKNKHIVFCEKCENYAEDLGFIICYLFYSRSIATVDTAGYLYMIHQNSMMDRSSDKLKLNALNEVTISVAEYYKSAEIEAKENELAVLCFLIMDTEYRKIKRLKNGLYRKFPSALGDIKNKEWFNAQMNVLRTNKAYYRANVKRSCIRDARLRYIRHRLPALYWMDRKLSELFVKMMKTEG